MSEFMPKERDLTINPITGKPMIGRDLEQHYPSLQSSSAFRQSSRALSNPRGNQIGLRNTEFPSPKLKEYMKNKTERNGISNIEGENRKSKSFMDELSTLFRKDHISNENTCDQNKKFYEKFCQNIQNKRSFSPYDDGKYITKKPSSTQRNEEASIPSSRQLNTKDIEGAYPMRFRHKSRKLFIDRREAMSVFGQSPGKYHGFVKDYKSGGTYNTQNDEKMIVDDFTYYTKFKLMQKDMIPKNIDESGEIPILNNKSQNKSVDQTFESQRLNTRSHKALALPDSRNRSENGNDAVKMRNLYDYIKADENRANQSMLLNHSLNSKNSKQNYFDVYEMFKDNSILK